MPRHLLRVERPPPELAELIAAVRREGARVGWLELPAAPPQPLPEALAEAAGCGVLRAVAVAGGRSVAVKPMRGEPVLRDLLREHFRGCLLVLVRGDVAAPRLAARDEGWSVDGEHFTTAELIAALRKPHPWG